ncbi:Hypothetical protein LUCI_1902 [Lucifera butyrica]|uniref:Uncharacterized protein n=2 Tax=Lucifera butyrica TaxID=1351585 RepID=A0A498R216_9FIRM|nr:Hypothetical protein LUCI_1902 [Lucifera butyrica]
MYLEIEYYENIYCAGRNILVWMENRYTNKIRRQTSAYDKTILLTGRMPKGMGYESGDKPEH